MDEDRAVVPPLQAPARCSGYVALTFDDSPTPLTAELVDVLRTHDLSATFFINGALAQAHPDAVRLQAATAGVQFGNHGWSHTDLSTLPVAEVRQELERTSDIHEDEVVFFRPPYGSASPDVLAEVERLGMHVVLWTVDSKDFGARSVEQVVNQSKGMVDGGILLLHDGNRMTAQAVPRIVEHYYDRGLCVGKVALSNQAQAPVESPELTFYARAVAP